MGVALGLRLGKNDVVEVVESGLTKGLTSHTSIRTKRFVERVTRSGMQLSRFGLFRTSTVPGHSLCIYVYRKILFGNSIALQIRLSY